jgi:transcriptional regulator with XRE-family HTH domain
MTEPDEASVLRLVVVFLRFYADMTQAEFGKASRVDQSDISKYEKGTKLPPEESLRRMATAAGLDWSLLIHLRRAYEAVLSASALRNVATDVQLPDPALLEPVLLAVTPYLLGNQRMEPPRQSPEEERREAEEIWTALESFPISRRRRLIEQAPRSSRSFALAVKVCLASLRAAPNDAREALDLADLALSITGRVPVEHDLRSRAQGYCWAHVGNARRVANDLDGADEAFTRAWDFWSAGAEAGSKLFPEWRLLSLEASLRRAQRRLPEALELLNRARAACTSSPNTAARILLQKETVLDLMGDIEGALGVLVEATPLVEASGNLHLLFSLHFNKAVDLCHLKRYAEAAALLPRVRELAIEQANELDLLRFAWLTARVAAGQGRVAEAVAGLEQVCEEFTARELPYDAALASLDLAVLWLKDQRAAEVKQLAVAMGWIFKTKGIHREALAALRLFHEAALQETATEELARRVIAELRRLTASSC